MITRRFVKLHTNKAYKPNILCLNKKGGHQMDTYVNTAVLTVAQAQPDERATFIRRTYIHLAGAVAAFVGLEAVLLKSVLATAMLKFISANQYGWLMILGAFIGCHLRPDHLHRRILLFAKCPSKCSDPNGIIVCRFDHSSFHNSKRLFFLERCTDNRRIRCTRPDSLRHFFRIWFGPPFLCGHGGISQCRNPL